MILYILVIGVPLYEMYKSSMDSKQKEERLYKRLTNIE